MQISHTTDPKAIDQTTNEPRNCMDIPRPEQELKDALDAFETNLETPIIPGEFGRWSQYVQESWPTVAALVRQEIKSTHRKQLEDIAKQDSEMLAVVKQIQKEDIEITRELDEVGGMVDRLAAQAPTLERTPGDTQDSAAAPIIKRGIDFITRVKTQQVAVRTWLSEAFNRERGVGD